MSLDPDDEIDPDSQAWLDRAYLTMTAEVMMRRQQRAAKLRKIRDMAIDDAVRALCDLLEGES